MSKIIQLSVAAGPFNSRGLLNQVVSMSPEKAINIGEMRKRVRILDAIETADGSFMIETDEWDLLSQCVRSFPFNVANKQVLQIIDDVLDAPDGPVITKEMRDATLAAAQAQAKAAAQAAQATPEAPSEAVAPALVDETATPPVA